MTARESTLAASFVGFRESPVPQKSDVAYYVAFCTHLSETTALMKFRLPLMEGTSEIGMVHLTQTNKNRGTLFLVCLV